VQALKKFGLASIAAGHCTGWRAMAALYIEFGDRIVTPLAVGKQFKF
jgi:7,8-dihydropterin-6-yl-methyl-4-(beta-D-ribofuranosyl)aminobenzene 5'-phosphate synthase